jgi:hypothetical protein
MYSYTHSGKKFMFEAPTVDMIEPSDLWHALALLCRFSGHVDRFYSVAQHSVLISKLVPVEHALVGLLHDATEAYLCDLPRYLKRAPGLEGYRRYEELTWKVICERFGGLEPETSKEHRGCRPSTGTDRVARPDDPPDRGVSTGAPRDLSTVRL